MYRLIHNQCKDIATYILVYFLLCLSPIRLHFLFSSFPVQDLLPALLLYLLLTSFLRVFFSVQ